MRSRRVLLLAVALMASTGILLRFAHHSESTQIVVRHAAPRRLAEHYDAASRIWLLRWVQRLGADATRSYVFYNRVGKCGSTTLMNLTARLSRENKFVQVVYYKGVQTKLHGIQSLPNAVSDKEVQQNSLRLIRLHHKAALHIHHTLYIDFSTEAQSTAEPIYINTVREPISRMESAFYYRQRRHPALIESQRFGRTLDDCLLQKFPACDNLQVLSDGTKKTNLSHSNRMLMYFCGTNPECVRNPEFAVAQALKHLKENYLIVGHLERINDFIVAIEFLLPEFFSGATKILKLRAQQGNFKKNQGHYARLSFAARRRARSLLAPSYALYNQTVDLFQQRFSLLRALQRAGVSNRLQLRAALENGHTLESMLSRGH